MPSKRLLFFTKMNFGNLANSGIKNKVIAQAKAFDNLGLETTLLTVENEKILIKNGSIDLSISFFNKIKFLKFLYFDFQKSIDIASYDFIYVRHFLTNPLFLWMLGKIKKHNSKIKIYLELPTYPYNFQNNKLSLSLKIQQQIDNLCTPFYKKYIDYIVTVSMHNSIFGIPTIKTDNGIDVDKYKTLIPNQTEDKTLHLLGLANVQTWHGFDRVIAGLAIYQNNKQTSDKVILHVVGNGDALEDLKQQVNNNGLNEIVQFHGFLGGEDLENMIKSCQVGIAVLGLHRVNLSHASALKAREFASRGLPFVASNDDFGFPEKYPYIHRVSPTDKPILINDLVYFYKNIQKNHPEYYQEMHTYAKNNFTWESKLNCVVEKYLS